MKVHRKMDWKSSNTKQNQFFAARPTFPIDTPNHEHGHYDNDEDIDEEAPTGDTDIAAT